MLLIVQDLLCDCEHLNLNNLRRSVVGQAVVTVGEDETPGPSTEEERIGRAGRLLASAAAYAMPLLASTPSFYIGLMTVPFLVYLIMMVANLSTHPEGPLYLLLAGSIPDMIVMLLGLAFTVHSVAFLWRKKPAGLVTTGPYGVVRHPQYLGLILFTGALTSRSVWILEHTFGFGLMGVPETIAVWFAMVFAYVGLALFEERHLLRVYPENWPQYHEKVGFLLPLLASQRRELEIVAAVLVFAGLMFGLVLFGRVVYFL
jgi:protein-S-isoprenylcysteine O-methyltransferase Ste14